MIKIYNSFFLAGFIFLSNGVFAQIVNVESKRPGVTNEGWHGSIDLNLNYTRNVSDVLDYGGKASLQYLKRKHRLLLLADLHRIRAGGDDFVNSGYQHIRYNRDLGAKNTFAFEAFQQSLYNAVQLISVRHLAGAGLRFNAVDRDSLKFWMGTLPMHEFEMLTNGSIERNIRQSSYLLFFFAFRNVEFQTINYYQPRWDDFSDFRFSSSNTIEVGILQWLRLVSSAELLYDSRVPDGVPDFVFTLKNGFKFEF